MILTWFWLNRSWKSCVRIQVDCPGCKVARRPWSPKDCPWIRYQNSLCSWSLKNILLSLNILRRPWKFLNSFEIFHFWTIDYIKLSRIKSKQCKNEQNSVDLFHLKHLYAEKRSIQERMCPGGFCFKDPLNTFLDPKAFKGPRSGIPDLEVAECIVSIDVDSYSHSVYIGLFHYLIFPFGVCFSNCAHFISSCCFLTLANGV